METNRILLRPWRESDAEALFRYASDPDVGPRAGWPPHQSIEESLEVIRTVFHNDTTWAIELRETGEAIGAMGYLPSEGTRLPSRAGEPLVGYWVGKPYWNRGICTDALRLMIDHIRQTTDIKSLISSHFIDNPASGRVMEKCGFLPTGETCTDETLAGCDRPMRVLRLEMEQGFKDSFVDALLSAKTDRIPDEYDWFAPLIGDWDCDYYDEPEKGRKRHVKGEWIFRRILEGTGIQDIFIFPSRATKETEPQPDGEYGSSFRMFNKAEHCYDVVYTCDHAMKRLCFTKQGNRLVGKVLSEENAYWIFSDITADSFRWENVRIQDGGEKFLVCEIFGRRIG